MELSRHLWNVAHPTRQCLSNRTTAFPLEGRSQGDKGSFTLSSNQGASMFIWHRWGIHLRTHFKKEKRRKEILLLSVKGSTAEEECSNQTTIQ